MSDSESTGPTTRAVERINRLVTWGRLAWIAIALGSGGVGTGVGFLLGEGAARATFEAKWAEHDRRLKELEASNADTIKFQQVILGKLEKVEGSLDVIKLQLMRSDK
jgi:hypothetical protein